MKRKQKKCDEKGNDKLPFFYASMKQNSKCKIESASCKQAKGFIKMSADPVKSV